MKILFISTIYPRGYAPTRGIFCLHTCRALAAAHEVRVISPRSWIEVLRRPSAGAGPADVGPTEYPLYWHPPGVLHSRSAGFMWVSTHRTVRRVIREFAPDCVLSYWAHPDGEVAARAARLAGVPVGVIVGGSDVLLLPQSPARGRAVTRALRAADAVFAVSRDLRERTVQLGVDPAKVHVVYQGVDPRFTPGDRGAARDRLALPRNGNLLLWVGRMDPVKGLEVLIDACARLRDGGIAFSLALVGSGPTRPSVAAEVRRRGLGDRVRFVGMVPHDQLPDWYRAADLTVLSSHSEGIPNVLRESLACGTPYVATRVGGIAELSDDPAVRLVPPADPTALANAIAASLATREQLRNINPGTWRDYAETVLQLLRPTVASPTTARFRE